MLRKYGLLLLVVASSWCAAQTPEDRCPSGRSFRNAQTITRKISGFSVEISKTEEAFPDCRFEVRDGAGQVIATGTDAQVEALPEMYVLRIGTNDLVIETFSGGAHCCWAYYIVTTLPKPHLAVKIANEFPIDFIDFRGIELNDLVSCDGGFYAFELIRNWYGCFPSLYVRFVRGEPHDVGILFRAQYDSEISVARSHLTAESLSRFREQAPVRQLQDADSVEADVLRIVLAYLYSGREEQAWKELAAMWPAGDYERIKGEILKARAKGILRYTQQ